MSSDTQTAIHRSSPESVTEPMDSDELLRLRDMCGKFRILVIGRANAGKTTICQMMCNTKDPPIVHDRNGNKIDIVPSSERGIHDINNEITYEANPGFVFHDSGGFESGSSEEMKTVHAFIKARSEATTLKKQLHAIWICLLVDEDRLLLPTEMNFFNEGTDSAPVIAVFTKCDAQRTKITKELKDKGINRTEIKEKLRDHVKKYLDGLVDWVKLEASFQPKGFVFMQDMHKELERAQPQCAKLIEKTSKAIDNIALQLLIVSVQQCNLKLVIKRAIHFIEHREKEGIISRIEKLVLGDNFNTFMSKKLKEILIWFPHFYFVSLWISFLHFPELATSSTY
ncbi:hypothetical protein BT96DRAFT_699892 [Gymnopus androsaceus JB14]|uniref:G domain-containing protein n=1 Tax=Gymnopus androsaceus JB14 TaxID=1447944 RepID=A0A6A4I8S4_9AGAR|nr:hypothetical protein BT96DRAFT_699892 [Gymnopus androsaceus JB14]